MTTPHAVTRRRMIVDAIAAGAFGAGAASLGGLAAPHLSRAAATPETDDQLIYATLAVEFLVIAVYERVIAAGQLTIDHQSLAQRILSFERLHARVLERELRGLGGAAPPPLTGASAKSLDAILTAKQVSQNVEDIGGDPDGLRLLIKVEEVAEGAYYAAMSKLSDPRLLLRFAQIMASEAQHRTVLSVALDPGALDKAVPVAFVQGRG